MSSTFPIILDTFVNPDGSERLDGVGSNPALIHATQHSHANDAIAAIQANLGIDFSTDVNTHDFHKNLLLMTQVQVAYNGTFREIVGQPFPTSIAWYNNPGKTIKLIEKTYTYNVNSMPNVVTFKLYDGTIANTLMRTIIDTLTYDGLFEVGRNRTIVNNV